MQHLIFFSPFWSISQVDVDYGEEQREGKEISIVFYDEMSPPSGTLEQ